MHSVTKEDSKCLYSVAILLMIFHHIFMAPTNIGIADIPFVTSLAWFGKICVAMYAYISGYAMASSLSNNENNKLRICYYKIFKRIVSFLFRYWIMFVVCVPMFVFTGNRIQSIKVLILNFLGIGFHYNGAWWYVRQYIIMLLICPIINMVILNVTSKVKKIIYLCFGLAVMVMFFSYYLDVEIMKRFAESVLLTYLIIFVEGILLFHCGIYKRLAYLREGYTWIHIICILVCVSMRMILATEAGYCLIDIMLIFPFTFSICILMNKSKMKKGIKILSMYSTYMWLVHCFYIEFAVKSVTSIVGESRVLMYGVVFVLSLATSIILKWIEEYLLKIKKLILEKSYI